MKITVLGYLDSSGHSGAGRRAVRHAIYFAEKKMDVTLISGIKPYKNIDKLRYVQTKSKGISIISFIITHYRLLKEIAFVKSDIIHFIPSSTFLRACLIMLSKITGKYIIAETTMDGSDDTGSLSKKKFGKFRAFAQKSADSVVCISPRLIESCKKAGVHEEKLKLIGNDVNIERFSPLSDEEKKEKRRLLGIDENAVIALHLGIVRDRKNVLFLIEVLNKIKDNEKKLKLIIAGSTTKDYEVKHYSEKVRNKIESYNLSDRVYFLGEVDDEAEYMQISDMFWFASKKEGFGTVLIEAMACGLPVISTKLDGITDWIISNSKNGFVVENINDFVNVALKLSRDEENRKNIGASARKTAVNRYSQQVIMQQYYDLYYSLLNSK